MDEKNIEFIESVKGFNGASNSVLISRCHKPATTVVFFPGDVQDLENKMLQHRDNRRYSQWNLEETTKKLFRKFNQARQNSCDVVTILPSTHLYGIFAVYSNFLNCDQTGNPRAAGELGNECDNTTTTTKYPWQHLEALLKSLNVLFDDRKLVLIAFSKGCVVLNALLENFSPALADSLPLFVNLSEMYWLDGGHSGGKNTWLTKTSDILPFLEKCGNQVKFQIDVTPYQVCCPNRPWNGKECRKFVKILTTSQAKIRYYCHFEELTPSLDYHFKILDEFCVSDDV